MYLDWYGGVGEAHNKGGHDEDDGEHVDVKPPTLAKKDYTTRKNTN